MVSDQKVSVIVPAYNAEATLDETLMSVRAQTHGELEIIVVDDGSADRTAELAERHVGEDPRVRLIRKENGGVASARNRGIAEASADYIAPVDADDLWHPEKIERQLSALDPAGKVGLVYCWFAIIDGQSRVMHLNSSSTSEGNVIDAMCVRNIVGNGSAPLMLRKAVEDAGGYDESLRARRAQGCEDYKLYFRIAETYDFALVRDYLVGYRELPENMSSDFRQMLRSRDLCAAEFASNHPRQVPRLSSGRARLLRFMISRSWRNGALRQAGNLLTELIRSDPRGAVQQAASLAYEKLAPGQRRTADLRTGQAFLPPEIMESFNSRVARCGSGKPPQREANT